MGNDDKTTLKPKKIKNITDMKHLHDETQKKWESEVKNYEESFNEVRGDVKKIKKKLKHHDEQLNHISDELDKKVDKETFKILESQIDRFEGRIINMDKKIDVNREERREDISRLSEQISIGFINVRNERKEENKTNTRNWFIILGIVASVIIAVITAFWNLLIQHIGSSL